MQKNGTCNLWVDPEMDIQWREHANRLFLCDPRVSETQNVAEADYSIIDAYSICGGKIPFKNGGRLIVLSLGDLYKIKYGLRSIDGAFRKTTRELGLTFIYIECETAPQGQQLYDDDHLHILSMPLGYIAGSKMNLHYSDKSDEAFHTKHIGRNPKKYVYDWCWIGVDSGEDRVKAVDILERQNGKKFFHRESTNQERDWDKRMIEIHADNKTVPYDDFMKIHRQSKVGISCNGVGMWCYKDAELLARNCFVLRQWHKNLDQNPLSPQDGKHWVVFKNGDLLDTLKYYVEHDDEREAINDAGHEYFKQGINGGWAEHYVDGLLKYMKSGDKHDFGELLYSNC